jgi:hypothetical protein
VYHCPVSQTKDPWQWLAHNPMCIAQRTRGLCSRRAYAIFNSSSELADIWTSSWSRRSTGRQSVPKRSDYSSTQAVPRLQVPELYRRRHSVSTAPSSTPSTSTKYRPAASNCNYTRCLIKTMDSDRGLQVFSLIPLIFSGYPGVFIQGFTDG